MATVSTKKISKSTIDSQFANDFGGLKIKSRAKNHCYFYNNNTKQILTCQFNPESMPYSRSVNFADISSPGMAYPLTQFTGGNAREVSLELFWYDPSGNAITSARNFFNALLPPESNDSNFKKPPSFTFAYGYFSRTYVLKDFTVNDERLSSSGTPIQSRFSFTMRQI